MNGEARFIGSWIHRCVGNISPSSMAWCFVGWETHRRRVFSLIAHDLIKQELSKNTSARRKINKAGWDNEFLARIVAGIKCVSPGPVSENA